MKVGLSAKYAEMMKQRGYFRNAKELLELVDYPVSVQGWRGETTMKEKVNYKPLDKISEEVGS